MNPRRHARTNRANAPNSKDTGRNASHEVVQTKDSQRGSQHGSLDYTSSRPTTIDQAARYYAAIGAIAASHGPPHTTDIAQTNARHARLNRPRKMSSDDGDDDCSSDSSSESSNSGHRYNLPISNRNISSKLISTLPTNFSHVRPDTASCTREDHPNTRRQSGNAHNSANSAGGKLSPIVFEPTGPNMRPYPGSDSHRQQHGHIGRPEDYETEILRGKPKTKQTRTEEDARRRMLQNLEAASVQSLLSTRSSHHTPGGLRHGQSRMPASRPVPGASPLAQASSSREPDYSSSSDVSISNSRARIHADTGRLPTAFPQPTSLSATVTAAKTPMPNNSITPVPCKDLPKMSKSAAHPGTNLLTSSQLAMESSATATLATTPTPNKSKAPSASKDTERSVQTSTSSQQGPLDTLSRPMWDDQDVSGWVNAGNTYNRKIQALMKGSRPQDEAVNFLAHWLQTEEGYTRDQAVHKITKALAYVGTFVRIEP